ncbi:hypothetical protein [Metapseudomonas otitidis]|uniref:hypothetical protein n=1 Tax=Metapseudomonas otitidis TaxID=319939 RepID=UPI0024496EBA|nr:hypothetical protein [Pseudomonas otitidis]MDH0335590.1 hypothetical protein [Pseudomonas otitidis]
MKPRNPIALLALLWASSPAFALDAQVVGALEKALTCQQAPLDARDDAVKALFKANGIVALAYDSDASGGTPGERLLHLLVARVDSASGRILERHEGNLEEDALLEISADSLWLDTARYRLAKDVRAFGVVISSQARGPSCPDAGMFDELTLFVPGEAATLRPVFTGYLREWITVQGTSCVNNDRFRSEHARMTLAIGPKSSHGFADLILSAQVSDDDDKPLRTVKKTLQYDGKTYPYSSTDTFWGTLSVD